MQRLNNNYIQHREEITMSVELKVEKGGLNWRLFAWKFYYASTVGSEVKDKRRKKEEWNSLEITCMDITDIISNTKTNYKIITLSFI